LRLAFLLQSKQQIIIQWDAETSEQKKEKHLQVALEKQDLLNLKQLQKTQLLRKLQKNNYFFFLSHLKMG
jgi:hypothetical protein